MNSDDGRLILAGLLAAVLSSPAIVLLPVLGWWPQLQDEGARVSLTLVYMALFWTAFGVAFMVLTLIRFTGVDARQLYRDLRTVSRGPNERSLGVWRIGSTLSWTVQLSITALVVVVAMMLDPLVRGHFALRLLGVAVVAVSWGMLVLAQALAYARLYARSSRQGIAFAGTPEPVYSDFLSLSVGVSAMFGPADATLSGRRVRTLMRNHVLVSFAFNSMVVATLATLLLVAD